MITGMGAESVKDALKPWRGRSEVGKFAGGFSMPLAEAKSPKPAKLYAAILDD